MSEVHVAWRRPAVERGTPNKEQWVAALTDPAAAERAHTALRGWIETGVLPLLDLCLSHHRKASAPGYWVREYPGSPGVCSCT